MTSHCSPCQSRKNLDSGGSDEDRTEGTRQTNLLLGGKDQELFKQGDRKSEVLLFKLYVLFKYI